MLKTLPYGEEYIEEVTEKKRETQLDLWTRPAIPWKLECEQDHTRQDAISVMQDAQRAALQQQQPHRSHTILYLSLTLVLLTSLCTSLNARCAIRHGGPRLVADPEQEMPPYGSYKPFMIAYGSMILAQVAFTSVIISLCIFNLQITAANIKSIDKMAFINDCGDDYTQLNGHELYHDMRAQEMR